MRIDIVQVLHETQGQRMTDYAIAMVMGIPIEKVPELMEPFVAMGTVRTFTLMTGTWYSVREEAK